MERSLSEAKTANTQFNRAVSVGVAAIFFLLLRPSTPPVATTIAGDQAAFCSEADPSRGGGAHLPMHSKAQGAPSPHPGGLGDTQPAGDASDPTMGQYQGMAPHARLARAGPGVVARWEAGEGEGGGGPPLPASLPVLRFGGSVLAKLPNPWCESPKKMGRGCLKMTFPTPTPWDCPRRGRGAVFKTFSGRGFGELRPGYVLGALLRVSLVRSGS